MKKTALIFITLFCSSSALSAPENVLSDKSKLQAERYQQICQAALISKETAKQRAVELNVGRRELNRIRCDEMTVMDFAKHNGEQVDNWTIATVQ